MKTFFKYIILILSIAVGVANGYAYNFRLRTVDAVDSVPVGQARLILSTQDSTVVVDRETDIYGDIEVHDIEKGEYILKLTHDDYLPYSALLMLNKDVNLGDIGLTSVVPEGTMLAEFTVEGARVVSNAEGHIITPSKKLAKYSNNILDYLDRLALPGMEVNVTNRTISVNGGVPQILVNGVKRSLTYLQTIDPKQIARIKYSDFPPAKYLLSGVSGVIDIILYEPVDGGTVYSDNSGCPYQKWLNTFDMLTYNHKDSEFSLNIYDNWNEPPHFYITNSTQWLDNEGNPVKEEDTENKRLHKENNLEVTGSYNYQNRHGFVFNAAFTGRYLRGKDIIDGEYRLNGIRNASHTESGKLRSFSPEINLYAQKEWTNGRLLEFNLVGSLSNRTISSLYENIFEDGSPDNDIISNDIDGRSPGFIFETQYTQPFGNLIRWNIGIKETFNHGRNIYNGVTDMSNQSETYLNTNIYGMNTHGFSYSVGGGASYRHTYLGGLAYDYWQPTGIFSLSQRINAVTLRLNGTYTPIFPTVSQMTDIVQDVQPGVSNSGNQSLKTSHNWNLSLNAYSILTRYMTLSATLTNRHTNNSINNNYIYQGDGQYLNTPVNFSNINLFDARVRFSCGNFLNYFSGNIELGWTNYRFSGYGQRQTFNSIDCRIFIGFLYKRWGASARFSPAKKTYAPFMSTKNSPTCELTVRYLLSPSWSFSLTVSNLGFAKGYWTRQSYDYPLMMENLYARNTQSGNLVRLNFTYQINYRRQYNKKEKGLRNMVVDQSVLSPIKD